MRLDLPIHVHTRFSHLVGAVVLGTVCLTMGSWSYAASGRPNFLFVYTDDQRWDALGVVQREQGPKARFPWLETPNMDRMAAEGVRFRNAFVVNSLCAPSRACFLTGRYSHLNGIANNHTPFPLDSVTHASLLQSSGYMTGYVGKWHMGSQSGPRPGFNYSASFIGQGQYFDCPFEINGQTTKTKGWVDDVSTDLAIQFLKEHKDQPFLLVVGYKATHGPFDPPERSEDRFAGSEAGPAANAASPPPFPVRGRKGKMPPAKPAAKPTTNLNYFRCIAAVDDNLGRLLATLDEAGIADNTMVIFTSDNGYYLGEHSLGDKRSAYDESLRIPLLLRYPKLKDKGKLVDQMVLNIDLASTLLDYAGVAIPSAMQGRSWKPLLENQSVEWRKAFFYEYFYERSFFTPTVLAVRTETAKLIKYPGHDEWTELFDLVSDPYETKNLAGDPQHRPLLDTIEAEFQRQAQAVGFTIPDYADRPEDEPHAPPRLNAFVLDYGFSRDEGSRVADTSGKNNHGKAVGTAVVEGRAGKKARQFDGKSWIEVPKSPTLNCAEGSWTVEAVVRADEPDGVILARGGKSHGYALYVEDGRPAFAVTTREQTKYARAKTPITGQWTHLAGVISDQGQLLLYVNGRIAAKTPLHALIGSDPNDAMQIGADLASPVLQYKTANRLVGLVESVRIFSGQRTEHDLRTHGAGMQTPQ